MFNGIRNALNRTLNAPSQESPEKYNEIGFTGELRKGMWVFSDSLGKLGIVTGTVGKHVTIDWVNEKGETTLSGAVQGGTLRQARFSEIPELRKPSPETALRFGYFN